MHDQRSLADAVSAALGTAIVSLARTRGGDINEAFDARLADGRRVFVKTNAHAGPRLFACEARGLDWLREARAVRLPIVLAASGWNRNAGGPIRNASGSIRNTRDGNEPASGSTRDAADRNETPFLVLERISSASPSRDFDETLGRNLARLHQSGAPCFGFDEANFIGSLPQDNTPCETWPEFYVTRRLEPQVRTAIDHGHAPSRWLREFERVFARMPELTGPPEPPARVHGDLWGGNVIADEHGAPCLIDPAVYGGHREMDLAMLRLFGGASPRCFAAYDEAWPLADGHARRVRLYQLYPLLTHVNLFGSGYVSAVESALRPYF